MMENLDPLAHLDPLANEAYLGCQAFLDQKDIEDSLDWMEPKGHQEDLEKRVKMDLLVQLAPQVQLVLLE